MRVKNPWKLRIMQPSIRYKRAIYGLFKVLFVAIKIGCRLKNSRELRVNEFIFRQMEKHGLKIEL